MAEWVLVIPLGFPAIFEVDGHVHTARVIEVPFLGRDAAEEALQHVLANTHLHVHPPQIIQGEVVVGDSRFPYQIRPAALSDPPAIMAGKGDDHASDS